MQFSDTSNKNGIIQQIEAGTSIGDGNITGTLLKQFTAQINNAYLRATNIIVSSTNIWTWDDSNQTNLPSATTNLIEDQAQYEVISADPAAGQDWLEVTGVNVKDSSGQWYKLDYKAQKRFNTPRLERETTSGQPSTYSFEGTQIFLDSRPNYSQTAGLEILFSRNPLTFSSTDTTKKPGFNSMFHEYLVLKGIYWWEKYKGSGNPEETKRDILEMEKAMGLFYGRRAKFEPTTIQRQPVKSRRGYK